MILSCGILMTSVALSTGLGVYSTIKASNPSPPVYRDVNGDGVEDKIIQKKVKKQLGLSIYSALEEEVLFGVKIDGKKIYLTKEEFKEFKK